MWETKCKEIISGRKLAWEDTVSTERKWESEPGQWEGRDWIQVSFEDVNDGI